MNKLDLDYQNLLKDILENGVKKETRNGGTLSVFGRQIRHKMSEGFPLLTTKKMAWKTMVTELLWFLRGDTNIKYLVDNNCHIWDGDAYKNYFNKTKDLTKDDFEAKGNGVIVIKGFDLKSINQYGNISGTISNSYFIPYTKELFINKIKTDDDFANKWGELGPVYGKQWRSWDSYDFVDDETHTNKIDQITNLINDLKTNPDSRRLMVSAWNVGEIDQMVLPPCHFSFQCYSHEHEGKRYLSLAWNQRSVDVGLGLPFNIASYGLLLEIIAQEVGMIPYELIGNLGDCHIYNNHIEGIKKQLMREPFELPKLRFTTWTNMVINDGRNLDWILEEIDTYEDWFALENYQSHPSIKLPLSN